MAMKTSNTMRHHNRSGGSVAILGLAALLLTLGGCSSLDNSDLDKRLAEIKARPAKKIPPLPVFKPYETFLYSASEEQDPFKLFDGLAIAPTTEEMVADNPLKDRNLEALEQYPLDTLRYVGQLTTDGRDWAIITSPDLIVHRVQVGNYLGQNYGRITAIQQNKILITETIADDYRGWIERDAALSLSE
ncbi:MAG: pilus assembly protein PilP [Gammaproteobacteria bacterium]|nr:pilus assembly protein PilP [Gammaproteobacteria bacterium]